ncbi:GNAT family N-acetyltransferase [Anaerolinea sp.]|uniref:GNAT family N-acetyltransferase n=1 Tax=Anaerolinea sp. TaxID=1872519 RepID=UPI00262E62DF|nr:GNAT family N-acetyltransferase [uncultured Anaerolinea sp.]
MNLEFEFHSSFTMPLNREWSALLPHSICHVPFLDPDYLALWWDTRGGGEWQDECQLVLVTARDAGRLVGIAPLFYTPNFKGKPRLMLLGSVEVSDYLDFVVLPEYLSAFCEQLLPFLRQLPLPEWHVLDLYNLFETSATIETLKQSAGKIGKSIEIERAYRCPQISLPGDWEQYLASVDKKQRHEIRRKMRRLENAGFETRWYRVENGDHLDEEFDSFVKLMEFDEEKKRFLTPRMRQFMRGVVHWAYQKGILHLAFLEIDGIKAAAYLAFDMLNRLWIYNSGINPDFGDFSPGWVLVAYQIQWANEQHREAFDFMRGDEEYKYRFGAVDRYLDRVTINFSN